MTAVVLTAKTAVNTTRRKKYFVIARRVPHNSPNKAVGEKEKRREFSLNDIPAASPNASPEPNSPPLRSASITIPLARGGYKQASVRNCCFCPLELNNLAIFRDGPKRNASVYTMFYDDCLSNRSFAKLDTFIRLTKRINIFLLKYDFFRTSRRVRVAFW